VADDVGLGKTIEAGLILQAAKAQGRVHRLLILCPASLVDQWKHRLFTMFGIRCEAYVAAQDGPGDDYWGGERKQVIASFHTLRQDEGERWNRLLAAEPWDLVLFDEAHHMGSDQDSSTLAYQLLESLEDGGRIHGLVFFTGTPHKGKDFAFLNLIKLLRPDEFLPDEGLGAHLDKLPDVMIRNAKHKVTDLQGKLLFHGVDPRTHQFKYSEAEQAFYDKLTEFIQEGLLFSGQMNETNQRAVGLVLTSLQKLAASSVAAIARAIRRRLRKLRDNQGRADSIKSVLALFKNDELDEDRRSELESKLFELSVKIDLVANEQPFLEVLLGLAARVQEETKILRIIDLVKKEMAGDSVLFFTEYKATQSLLIGALVEAFGQGCVGFINGDGKAEEIPISGGGYGELRSTREDAAERFNNGSYRFMVSTEAAGEGIDLQRNCHTLVHVDLPWNPMRLHQRVGRIYRYGQEHPVIVHKFYNPGTVESRIHQLLETKLKSISAAFGSVMDEPEDMMQLVLGMADPGFFEILFRNGTRQHADSLADWFDGEASTLGGTDVVEKVQALLGQASRFDFQGMGDDLPRVDLPDLKPFFQASLGLNGREWMDREDAGTFITPEAWLGARILPRYEGMSFSRSNGDLIRTLGADQDLFKKAMEGALRTPGTLGSVRERILPQSIHVFRVYQQVHPETAPPDRVVGLVQVKGDWEILRDWELILKLNPLAERYRALRGSQPVPLLHERDSAGIMFHEAEAKVLEWIQSQDLKMDHPGIEWLGTLISAIEAGDTSERPS
jgi:hypothetical protein